MHIYKTFKLLLLFSIISFSLYSLSNSSEFLTDDEQNSIKVFEENVKSVVNVSTMVKKKTGFFSGTFQSKNLRREQEVVLFGIIMGISSRTFTLFKTAINFRSTFTMTKRFMKQVLLALSQKKTLQFLNLKELPQI